MKSNYIILGLATLLMTGATAASLHPWADNTNGRVRLTAPTCCKQPVPSATFKASDDVVADTLVDENFSLMTKGSEEQQDTVLLSSVSYSNYPYIDNSLTHKPGWSSMGAYQAGGCIALGDTAELGGCLNTPEGDYSGETTISFRVKNIGSRSAYLFVSFCKGGPMYPQEAGEDCSTTKTLKKNSGWKEISVTYNNYYGGADCFIQINAAYSHVLIDDVKVQSKSTFLPAPILGAATDFTVNGFTANWSPVAKATDYLLTVYRQIPAADVDSVEVTEDFEGMELNEDGTIDQQTIPAGWEIKLHGNPALYVQDPEGTLTGDVSLRMSATGDTITTPYNGGMLKHFNMHIWKVKEVEGGSNAKIQLELNDGAKWVSFGSFYVSSGIPTTTKPANLFLDYNLGKVPNFYQVRLIAQDFEEGTEVAFDDLDMWTTTPTRNDTVILDRPETGTKALLDDLDPYSDYFYYVRSRNTERNMISPMPDKVISAFGVATPKALEAENVNDRGSFDARWTSVPKATSYIVDFYNVYKASRNVENYELLNENFNGSLSYGTADDPQEILNYNIMSLDDYASNTDWYGRWNIAAESALGVDDIANTQEQGELQSPTLSLAHGDSIAHISLKVCGKEGDYLVVSNLGGQAAYIPLSGEYKEYSFDLPNCQDNDILLFTSYQGGWFLLDDVTVAQDLKIGDEVWMKKQVTEETGNTATSHHFSALAEQENTFYGYCVTAKYTKNARTAYSDVSNRITVDPYLMGVSSASTNKVGNNRRVMYDLQGRRIQSLNGKQGVFIIKAGDKTQKVIRK